jgi:prefoldin subunit 5
MPDDIDKRVSAIERSQDRMTNAVEQINKTLARFEAHIDELFEVKTKLDSIDVIWRRIDELQKNCNQMDKEFHVLKSEHHTCTPIVASIPTCKADFENRIGTLEKSKDAVGGFTKNLVGGLLGQILWALIGGGALAAIYLAGKGAFTR